MIPADEFVTNRQLMAKVNELYPEAMPTNAAELIFTGARKCLNDVTGVCKLRKTTKFSNYFIAQTRKNYAIGILVHGRRKNCSGVPWLIKLESGPKLTEVYKVTCFDWVREREKLVKHHECGYLLPLHQHTIYK